MSLRCCCARFFISPLLIVFLVPSSGSQATQTVTGQKRPQDVPTIQVKVVLVQTDVMVFDRQGRFVPDLKLDQFELRVDGRIQPISFLELISAGSPQDNAVWAKQASKQLEVVAPAIAPNPGRTLLYFVDDWHMSEDNVMRSRAALKSLLETSMGPKDLVALAAASGQLGAIHQLTNDKAATLSLLEKLNYMSPGVQDLAYPPMTEAQAVAIEHNDLNMITYFVQAIVGRPVVRMQRGWELPNERFGSYNIARDCDEAEKTTRRRAADLAHQSAAIGERTIAALRGFLRAAEDLPGRKTVFFLSDGFVLQPQRSDIVSKIWDLTTAAARAGIVVYTLDSRGLVVGLPDARTKRAPDITGAAASAAINEALAGQDALNALAADTGGRFLKNTNALDAALSAALAEISRYYLLGWHVEPDKLQPGKYSTIRAVVKGRPDLRVRIRQGSLDLSRLVSK